MTMAYPEYVERVKKLFDDIKWEGDNVHDQCPYCWSRPAFKRASQPPHHQDCELDLLRKEVPE